MVPSDELVQWAFQPCILASLDRLWTYCDPDQDKAVIADEGINPLSVAITKEHSIYFARLCFAGSLKVTWTWASNFSNKQTILAFSGIPSLLLLHVCYVLREHRCPIKRSVHWVRSWAKCSIQGRIREEPMVCSASQIAPFIFGCFHGHWSGR